MLNHPETLHEHAIIVYDYYNNNADFEAASELIRLAQTAGAKIDTTIRLSQTSANRKTYVSSGKVTEISQAINKFCSTLVILESTISPIQERNLERELSCRVIDRVRLILDIFALRARSREGKLQVELAQLQHLSTRLVRGWSHLERQRGGIGLRGPGETQLETDRRLLGVRIKRLKKQLDKVSSQRALHRRRRERESIPLVSLVGYTNAGKSLLFNKLTGADVYTADKLFATLDPTVRRIEVPEFGPVLLLDTVGFIRNLPTSLIKSFRATLEEICVSQLLLHVVDFSEENHKERMSEVDLVLDEIGALEIPRLIVFNKIDLTDKSTGKEILEDLNSNKVWLSALSGVGMGYLRQLLQKNLGKSRKSRKLFLSKEYGKFRSKLYDLAEVQDEKMDEEGNWVLEISIEPADEGRLNSLRGHSEAFSWLD